MPNVLSTTCTQGSFGFNLGLPFTILGYDDDLYDDGDEWEVRIVTPNGTELTKTTGLSFPDPSQPVILVPVTSGDLNEEGVYAYQVMKSTGDIRLISEQGSLTVNGSLPSI